MIGAIAGDIIGCQYEWTEFKKKKFPLFTGACHYTDDSLMTLAIGDAFVTYRGDPHDEGFSDYVTNKMVEMGRAHQGATWGLRFYEWFMKGPYPSDSYGNGAAMRVSSVGWVSKTEQDVKYFARLVTVPSHNHPEAIKGAEAVAMAIFLARVGRDKEEIRERMIEYYPRIKGLTVDKIRPEYGIDDRGMFMSCQGSVPEAIVAFLDSTDYEDAVRNAVSLGGDTDTQACISGSIAEAYYGVPEKIASTAYEYLTPKLRAIYDGFHAIMPERVKRATEESL